MNEDLDELRSGLREALASIAPIDTTAARMELPESWDADVWRQLSAHLALPGLGLPEKYGGQGFGTVEQGIALEETGRVLYPGPYLAGPVFAGQAIVLSGDEVASADLLPGIAAGTTIATLALTDGGGKTSAVRVDADSVLLTGTKVGVIAGADADLVVVVADCDGEPVLAVVERGSDGLAVERTPVLDLTRRMAQLTFSGARGRLLQSARPGAELVEAVMAAAGAALCSEQVGAAAGALDLTVEYARTRVQFGREIGTFQALRHRLADLHAEVQLAAATARAAAAQLDAFSIDAAVAAATAQSFCSETFVRMARETIQLHGGIGFTWEHPAHLYFKRAKSSELLLGGPEAARVRLGRLLSHV